MAKDVIFIHSGLGNQMFQYAFYLYRKRLNPRSKCDSGLLKGKSIHNGFELNTLFDLHIKSNLFDVFLVRLAYYAKYISRIRFITCIINCLLRLFRINYIDDKSSSKKGIINYYVGYWQSPKNFIYIDEEIRKVFLFKTNYLSQKTIFYNDIIHTCNSVSIHIRRGDYNFSVYKNIYGNICTIEYYKKAINYICERISNPTFFIFSDDIEWVRENISTPNSIYISHNKGKDSWQDMYLMSQCKHNIIANSTFSWWGAYLNNNTHKIIICPYKFDNVGASIDIFPNNWIKI